MRDFLKVLWKEIRVALLVGMALFVANSIKIYIQYKDITLCLVLGITLFLTIIISKIIGSMLPMIVKKLKQDPAIVAAPFITTVVDLASVMIYFKIATMLLGL